eukprot:gene12445-14399_t
MLRAVRNQTVFVNRVWNAPVMRSFHASVVSLAEGKAPKAPAVKDETKVHSVELISDIAEDTGLTKKDVQAVLRSLPAVIAHHVSKGKTVYLNDIGIIKTVDRKGRTFHNPTNGKPVEIGDRKLVKITTAVALRKLVK